MSGRTTRVTCIGTHQCTITLDCQQTDIGRTKIKSKEHAQEKSQDVAEAQDSTLPTTSAERVLLTGVIGGKSQTLIEAR